MLLRLSIAIMLASAPAFAQHDHAHDHDHHHDASAMSASVSVVAASFDNMLYVGNYQGVLATAGWSDERFAAAVTGSAYRVEKNGADAYGAGDLGAHGQAALVGNDAVSGGVSFAVSVPTGNSTKGMGMGHVMLMPAIYGGWRMARMKLAVSVGYSRALGNGEHDGHGPWPLVSPMLSSEVSWSAGGEVAVSKTISAGVRGAGGIPVATEGDARVMVAGRVGWRTGRVDSTVEVQAGVAGDPFTLRGVVSTALTF